MCVAAPLACFVPVADGTGWGRRGGAEGAAQFSSKLCCARCGERGPQYGPALDFANRPAHPVRAGRSLLNIPYSFPSPPPLLRAAPHCTVVSRVRGRAHDRTRQDGRTTIPPFSPHRVESEALPEGAGRCNGREVRSQQTQTGVGKDKTVASGKKCMSETRKEPVRSDPVATA